MEADQSSMLISHKSNRKSLKDKSSSTIMVPSLMEEEDNEDEINQILEKTGGFGRLQCIMIFAMLICYQGIGYFLYGLPFFELVPKIMCIKSPSGVYEDCDTSDICNNGNLIDKSKWYVDYSDELSYHNWMTDLEMYCDSSFMIGLFGSAFFVGFMLSGLILKQSDRFGRKKIIVFGVFIQLLCCYGMYFIPNQYILYVLLFISGLIVSKNYVIYILITEIVPDNARLLMGGICMACDSFFPIMTQCIYYMSGGKEWKTILIVPLVITPISFIVSLFILESPRYLHAKRKFKELRQNIKTIAKINGVKIDVDALCFGRNNNLSRNLANEIKSSEESKNQIKGISTSINENYFYSIEVKEPYSVIKELKNKRTLINLIAVVACFTLVSFDFYMIGFYLKYVGGNLYLNAMLATLSENFGNFGAVILQKTFGTRCSYVTLFIGAMLFGLPLIFFDQEWILAACIFSSKFCVEAAFMLTFYVNSETFSPLFVSFSFSACTLVAKAFAILAPQVAEVKKPIPLIVYCAFAGCGSLVTLLIRKPSSNEPSASEMKKSKDAKEIAD